MPPPIPPERASPRNASRTARAPRERRRRIARVLATLLLPATILLLAMDGCGGGSTETDIAPATPQGLSASPGDGEITLAWSANDEDDLDGYTIYWGAAGGTLPNTQTAGAQATSTTVTGLDNGTTYAFAITAVDAAGNESPRSDPVTAIPTGSEVCVYGSSLYDDCTFAP